MSGLSTLTVCPAGHVIHYPQVLDDQAAQTGNEIVFCSACECGTVYLVVIWAGDRARVMASGDAELARRLEAAPWPETMYVDHHGTFAYRTVGHPLEITTFLKANP